MGIPKPLGMDSVVPGETQTSCTLSFQWTNLMSRALVMLLQLYRPESSLQRSTGFQLCLIFGVTGEA